MAEMVTVELRDKVRVRLALTCACGRKNNRWLEYTSTGSVAWWRCVRACGLVHALRLDPVGPLIHVSSTKAEPAT